MPLKPGFRSSLRASVAAGLSSLFVCCFAPDSIPPTPAVAGFTPGNFSTDHHGSALYQIPLVVPPGTMGVQPGLALIYNSQIQNGLLGMGWTLSGLSSIARCRGHVDPDAPSKPETIPGSLCLDGVHLVEISPGEFRTEKDSWSRIRSLGNDRGDGQPQSFEVTSNDGARILFGADENARIRNRGSDIIRIWAMSRVYDRNGNYISVRYDNRSRDSGEYSPVEILYTLNDESAPPLTARRKVVFLYETRPDRIEEAETGAWVSFSRRLRAVRTLLLAENGWSIVKEYRISFTVSPTTGRSLLESVEEWSGSGEHLPPKRMAWQQGAIELGESVSFGSLGGEATRCRWGDFDGDGMADLLCDDPEPPYRHWVRISDGTQAGLDIETREGAEGAQYSWADFNGDGRVDLLVDQPDSGVHVAVLSEGDHFGARLPLRSVAGKGYSFHWADFNGDGMLDLLCSESEAPFRHFVALSTGSGLREPIELGRVGSRGGRASWIDFNGDGRSDLILAEMEPPILLSVRLSNGGGLEPAIELGAFGDTSGALTWADLNGDGLPDLMFDRASESSADFDHSVRLSTGYGLEAPRTLSKFGKPGALYRWLDFNGDKRADLLVDSRGANRSHWVLLSEGAVLSSEARLLGAFGEADSTLSWADVNGDGLPDLAADAPAEERQHRVRLNRGPHPDLLTKIENGLGGEISVSYRPLTDDSIYQPLERPELPAPRFRPVQLARYVVDHHHSSDGRENPNSYAFDYTYTGAYIDTHHHGWLGFRTTRVKNAQTGVSNTTTYGQEFPFTGLIEQATVRDADGRTLTSDSYAYQTRIETNSEVTALFRVGERRTFYDIDRPHRSYAVEKEHGFDPNGNRTWSWDKGDPADSSDDVFTCTRFAADRTHWVLALPTESRVYSRAEVDADGSCQSSSPTLRASRLLYTRDGRYNVRERQEWDAENESWIAEKFEFDSLGNVVARISPMSGRTALVYDEPFRTFVVRSTNQLEHVEEAEFDPRFGTTAAIKDPNGIRLEMHHDPFGRLLEIRGPDPEGALVTLSRTHYRLAESSATARLYVETLNREHWGDADPSGWPWKRSFYDGRNRVWRSEAGRSGTRTIRKDFRFDDEARPAAESRPYFAGDSPVWTTLSFDDMGRMTDMNDAGIVTSTIARGLVIEEGRVLNRTETTLARGTDVASSTESRTDARGKIVRTLYSGSKQQKDPAVRFGYDLLENLIRVDKPNGVQTEIHRDSIGRAVAVLDTEAGSIRHIYNGRTGALVRSETPLGEQIEFSYDELGRLTTQTTPDRVVRYRYDNEQRNPAVRNAVGRVSEVLVEAGGRTSTSSEYSYDPYGRVATLWVEIDGRRFERTYSYDATGRPSSVRNPDASRLDYAYDREGHLASLSLSDSETKERVPFATFGDYDAEGRARSVRHANGVTSQFEYDPVGRISRATTSLPGRDAPEIDLEYRWNHANRLEAIIDRVDDRSTQTFGYSPEGYLSTADAPGLYQNIEYAYDGAGNMIRRGPTVFHHQGQRLVRAVSEGTETRFRHDAAGRMIARTLGDRRWSYSYDAQGHLLGIRKDGIATYSFEYGPGSRRIRKRDEVARSTVLYPFPDYEVDIRSDGSEAHTRYLSGPVGRFASITRQYEPTRAERGASVQFFVEDHIRSSTLVTDEVGTSIARLFYKPFGELFLLEGEDTLRVKFSGKELDERSGLYYFGARYYDPSIARFLTPDRLLLGGPDVNAAAFHRYAYVGNMPVEFTDPTGSFFGLDDATVALIAEAITVAIGTYLGGAAVNDSLNPAQWEWSSPKTYVGLVVGATAPLAGGEIAMGVGSAIEGRSGVAIGMAIGGAFENGSFTALGGGGPQEIAEAMSTGAIMSSASRVNKMGRFGSSRRARGIGAGRSGARRMARVTPKETGCLCLAGATTIDVGGKQVPIEVVAPGVWIDAYDVDRERVVQRRIVAVSSRETSETVRLGVGGEEIVSTPEHPFWVAGKGWVAAGELRAGERLKTRSGVSLELTTVEREPRGLTAYDLEVEGAHTFFVTESALLAHNRCFRFGPDPDERVTVFRMGRFWEHELYNGGNQIVGSESETLGRFSRWLRRTPRRFARVGRTVEEIPFATDSHHFVYRFQVRRRDLRRYGNVWGVGDQAEIYDLAMSGTNAAGYAELELHAGGPAFADAVMDAVEAWAPGSTLSGGLGPEAFVNGPEEFELPPWL